MGIRPFPSLTALDFYLCSLLRLVNISVRREVKKIMVS